MATQAEIDRLRQMVMGEARGEGFNGMVAAAYSPYNRVNDPQFPNTITGVVNPGAYNGYEAGRFGPGDDGWNDAVRAVDAVFGGTAPTIPDPTGGALYFKANNVTGFRGGEATNSNTIGGHTFYNLPGDNIQSTSAPRPSPTIQRASGNVSQNGALDAIGGQTGGGSFVVSGLAESRGSDQIDPRMVEIMRSAAAQTPYDVELFSGKRFGTQGSRHDTGNAVDVILRDPETGQEIPNLGAGGEAFEIYENFANAARQVQMDRYPDMSDQFRWGGYMGSSRLNPTGFDEMHFDFKPGGAMAMGDWENGLNRAGERGLASLGSGKSYSSTGIAEGVMPTTVASSFGYNPQPASRSLPALPSSVGGFATGNQLPRPSVQNQIDQGIAAQREAMPSFGPQVSASDMTRGNTPLPFSGDFGPQLPTIPEQLPAPRSEAQLIRDNSTPGLGRLPYLSPQVLQAQADARSAQQSTFPGRPEVPGQLPAAQQVPFSGDYGPQLQAPQPFNQRVRSPDPTTMAGNVALPPGVTPNLPELPPGAIDMELANLTVPPMPPLPPNFPMRPELDTGMGGFGPGDMVGGMDVRVPTQMPIGATLPPIPMPPINRAPTPAPRPTSRPASPQAQQAPRQVQSAGYQYTQKPGGGYQRGATVGGLTPAQAYAKANADARARALANSKYG